MNRLLPLVCSTLLLAQPLAAQEDEKPPLRLTFPIADLPYNSAHGVRLPSMEQALSVTESFYELTHRGIEEAAGSRRTLAGASIAAFDLLTFILPGADAWLHEEFHRSVMGRRGIDSFNDVYNFDFESETIAVSHVDDADLVRLKLEHPAEQVRMSSAGIEGEYLLAQRLERNRFFNNTTRLHIPLYWLIKFSSFDYVRSGHTDEADELTDDLNREDGADVEKRDFTGHDFTAWAYDLHRPAEPYQARGVHPSGVGIDRYIKASDLTQEERDYLKTEGRLQLLNFIDPFLVGVDGLNVSGRRVNFNVGHVLTSFGHTVDLNLFVSGKGLRSFVVLHLYQNRDASFPGIDASLLDVPVSMGSRKILLSPRASLWLQPKDQDFYATKAAPGGLVALRALSSDAARVGLFAEVEAKTAGWVAGNVYLGSTAALRVGGFLRLNQRN